MKSTLKRESKGLEVVKMETNGFSTDRSAGIKAERIFAAAKGWRKALPRGCRRLVSAVAV
jgi:hypothetical protein